jgi:alcohol dehydrogenase class IV
MNKSFDYFVPVKLVFGAGRVKEVGTYAKRYGTKALIVTTGALFGENGYVERVRDSLNREGIGSEYYPDVSPNPLNTQIDRGAQVARRAECDMAIGLGGGSAIDAAKGIAIVLGHDRPIWDFCAGGPAEITEKTYPIIAVTTTAGTGSEGTQWSVITNPDTREKPGIGNDHTFAKVAVVDPELMVSMPPEVTASTGFDVLAHAIEAYTSTISTPVTDLYCEQAIRLVGKYLRRAYRDGTDMEARTAMAYANTLSGFAIAVGVVTICHGLGHAVGGVANTTHGRTLAALTPHAMRFSMNHNPDKYRNIGMFLRNEYSNDGPYRLEDSVNEVQKLVEDLDLLIPLSKQGVRENELEAIAEGTLRYMDFNLSIDPARAKKEDLLAILREAL